MHLIMSWMERHPIDEDIVLTTLALLIGAAVVIFILNRLLRTWLHPITKRVGLPSDVMLSFTRVLTISLWVVVVLFLLDLWGVSVVGIWTVLASGAAVVGVGFLATWAMVSNVTASVFLAFWRPFHIGDTVALLPENLKGRAVDRNLMFTVLAEDDGSLLQVPNNLFFQKMFRVARP
jgi:small-conductance mechanosensitive channel